MRWRTINFTTGLFPALSAGCTTHGLSLGRFTGQTNPRWQRQQFEDEILRSPEMQQRFPDGIPVTWRLTPGGNVEQSSTRAGDQLRDARAFTAATQKLTSVPWVPA